MANIAVEQERAKTIHFSPAYCQIQVQGSTDIHSSTCTSSSTQATYLVPAGSSITSMEEVDRPGVRIATKARGAYDLWLTDHIEHATIHRADSIEESFQVLLCFSSTSSSFLQSIPHYRCSAVRSWMCCQDSSRGSYRTGAS